jgi:hypothetical protein
MLRYGMTRQQLQVAVLSKRLGIQLITNGGFDSDVTGWTNLNSTTFEFSGGRARVSTNGTGEGFLQALTLVNGATYLMSYDWIVSVGTGFTVSKNGMPSQGTHTGTGSNAFMFVDSGANVARNLLIQSAGTGDHVFTLDNFSLRRVL